ncbi:hypothetical protein [Actinacidiphila paucisporea]|uniref:Secreted protein n=1 Tax=Actinacidiphila paucisporea TaxID=310782 RepID=A0A1M7K4D0_9ACTN|nr:hypothetical protein [Actinacidiphila paucisporea]SHM60116.1 hypothetical protein SAMN05216499_112143 [Actinacidiphila paucisporea]
MRIRTTFAAACAVGIALSFSVSAHAADGQFYYTYGDHQVGVLDSPQSQECITLPEVADQNVAPANAPFNATESAATVFTGPDCTGDYFTLRAQGKPASSRLLLRSVVFS